MELSKDLYNPLRLAAKKKVTLGHVIQLWFSLLLTVMVFFASSSIDIPVYLTWGAVSGSAAMSVIFAGLAWLLWLFTPISTRTIISVMAPVLLFLGWIILSNIWGDLTLKSIQNQTIWVGFVGLIILFGYVGYKEPEISKRYPPIIRSATILSMGLFYVVFVSNLNGWQIPFSIGYRQFALFMLIPLSWFLIEWQLGRYSSLSIVTLIIASIILSLSRVALLSAGIILILSIAISQPKYVLPRLILAVVIGVGALFYLFTQFEPLANRDEQYAVHTDLWFRVGNIEIYGSGRVKMWSVTIESLKESPWLGQGAGSASDAVMKATGWLEHPHNDYLRILHDYGMIGLSLFLTSMSYFLRRLWLNWHKSVPNGRRFTNRHFHGSAFLLLIAFAISMITDNVVAYYFLMFPLGILIGISLGLSSRQRIGV